MGNATAYDFKAQAEHALADDQVRRNLRAAMTTLMEKRRAIFNDHQQTEQLRDRGAAIKRRCLQKLPELLERLEQKCTQNDIQVHWADTTDRANATVLDILNAHGATRLVKGKSMVSEEMHLNAFLEGQGIESMETDLGEYIIQLENEPPSHIIVPAIHKNKDEIARSFHEKIPNTPYTEDVEELTAIARTTLRRKFFEAQAGLSGVNFAIAETGTLLLVENEGNGRMCTTVPPVHIAVMGLEKVVEKLADVPPLLRLLTGSATGQMVTTYVNMITSPRKADEKDGPKAVHLIILDNGRSRILADRQLRETLLCIRCGTCLNHCPVYIRIGGHAYGFVYPGPIGKILTPQMAGLRAAGDLATASSLCGACGEVCPVKIPIPDLIRRLRNDAYGNTAGSAVKDAGAKKCSVERAVWKGWALVNRAPALNAANVKMLAKARGKLPNQGPLAAWTRVRCQPRFAPRSLHDIAREKGVDNE